ncbi:MAG: NAD(P)H-hydrate dehydratase [Chloroflexi bacterium]|nr:NAD(P)H-hydrate dehydratase [Chloroflexota bacterium]
MKILYADQMRKLEQLAAYQGVSPDTLMENAGIAIARRAWKLLQGLKDQKTLVLVGPGNNGGDGLIAARHLQSLGACVTAYLCAQRREADPKVHLAQEGGVQVVALEANLDLETLKGLLASTSLVIDALLGTGRLRPLGGSLATALRMLNTARAEHPDLRLLALDLPSGLNADTGEVDPLCPTADVTVTLGYPKAGLFLFPGAERVGRLEVTDIGIPPSLVYDLEAPALITAPWVREALPSRPLNAHKGTFGRVLVVAGSSNYIGAAYLACMGAARSGAGYVTLASLPSIQGILATKLTEVTYLPLPEGFLGTFSPEAAKTLRQALNEYNVLLIGCGLGQLPSTAALIRHVLLADPPLTIPLVIDADALNLLAQVPDWWEQIKAPTVVTPHPGEMARLLDRPTATIQQHRWDVVREVAQRWDVTAVLKGAFSVIASPQGTPHLSPFANSGLATAGTGDVLAGVIAGLMAQGMGPFEAAAAGVYLHGAAGELVRQDLGEAGMIAGDLLPVLPQVIKKLRQGSLDFPF